MAFILMLGFWLVSKAVKNIRRRSYVRLQGEEVRCLPESPLFF